MGDIITDVRTELATSKRVTATGRSTTVEYRVEPSGNSTVHVQLLERLPEPVSRSEVLLPDEDRGEWEYLDDQYLTYIVEVSRGEAVETSFSVADAVGADAFDSEVVVSTLDTDSDRPVSPIPQLVGDGHGASYNGNGTGSTGLSPSQGDPSIDLRQPAVGLLASEEGTAGVATTTLEALDRGLSVFVTAPSDRDTDGTRVARQLGATIVRAGIDDPDREDLRTALAVAARERGYPGVLIAEGSAGLDFDASLAAFERTDDQVVDAIRSRARTETLAGIPAYNEAETIASVVQSAAAHVDEVLVVDDGSDDDTVDRARVAGATVVSHDRNRGYGQALKTLFEQADARSVDHLVVLDADGQHDAADIPTLVERQCESGAEIVVGSRFSEGSDTDLPLYRWFGLRVITTLLHASTGTLRSESRISDTQSGFRAYHGTAVSSLAESADALDDQMGASVDILRHAHQNGFEVEEVPTTIRYDVENPSTQNPVRHGMSVVFTILRTLERDRPITVLGVPGVLATLVGVGVGFWTLSTVLAGGRFSVASALLSAMLVFGGGLSSFTAAVIHSLNARFGQAG